MALGQFHLWSFRDLDARGSLGRRRYLSGTWVREERLPTVVAIASLRTSPFIVIARTSKRVGRCATFDVRSPASESPLEFCILLREGLDDRASSRPISPSR